MADGTGEGNAVSGELEEKEIAEEGFEDAWTGIGYEDAG